MAATVTQNCNSGSHLSTATVTAVCLRDSNDCLSFLPIVLGTDTPICPDAIADSLKFTRLLPWTREAPVASAPSPLGVFCCVGMMVMEGESGCAVFSKYGLGVWANLMQRDCAGGSGKKSGSPIPFSRFFFS